MSVKSIKNNVLLSIPCLLRGGTEMQTLLLVRALFELGYKVDVCCYFENDEKVVAEFKAEGASVIPLGWSRSIGASKFIRSLARVFRQNLPSVVDIQYMTPGLLPIVAARLAKVPYIIATVHQPGTTHSFKDHLLLRFGSRLTNRFICVSEAAEKSWFGNSFLFDYAKPEQIRKRRHFTIHNAVDIVSLDKIRAKQLPVVEEVSSHLKGKFIIGSVSRLSPEKGIDILFKAFAEVHKNMNNTHLLVVGEGNQQTILKELADRLNLSHAITWTGSVSHDEAIGFLRLMDVVVVPSRYEGFGLSAIEAMACSKTVVASHVDGLVEIIQDGVNGFLIASEDVNSFADCIIALAKDEKKRKSIGAAAKRCVEEKYTYPIFRERIRALYKMF